MCKIKYLGFYDIQNGNRVKSLAAINKMNYIIDALNEIGYSVDIVSYSRSMENKGKNEKKELSCKNRLIFFNHSKRSKFKLIRIIQRVCFDLRYFNYLIATTKKEEIIISYHSLDMIIIELLLIMFKKVKLVLEVEEIYNDLKLHSKLSRYFENLIFSKTKFFIFPTELLQTKLAKNKKSIISYGTYHIEKKLASPPNDGKIHMVYAGNFNAIKGGAYIAIECAKYLSERYVLHIIGFGNQEEILKIKETIKNIGKESKCKIVYDGEKNGIDYVKYIQKCHIGLSTQNPNEKYNDSSFPSKILSYLANGLRVVSIKIPVVQASKISKLMYFYEEPIPKKIAETIKNICIDEIYDSKLYIEKLNQEFIEQLKEMLSKI